MTYGHICLTVTFQAEARVTIPASPRLEASPVAPGRRARRRAEIRERIFRAALRLFAERGFAATTVHDKIGRASCRERV